MRYLRTTVLSALLGICGLQSLPAGGAEDEGKEDIVIVEGDDRMVYEYRVNGYLMMIKVVPASGRVYYLVPGDGSPHYTDLVHHKKLYPRWVLVEW